MTLAIFDFDGTVTTKGSFADFIFYPASRTLQIVCLEGVVAGI